MKASNRDKAVLKAIEDLTRENGGVPPSQAEIAERVGIVSLTTVKHHLVRLRAMDLLTWRSGTCRTYRILGHVEDKPGSAQGSEDRAARVS